MAITTTALASDNLWPNSLSPHNITGNFTVQPVDTIQGQMITASIEMRPYEMQILDDVDMKKRLIQSLCMELLSAKCIEFTRQQNPDRDTVTIRARVFATPDSQVRIIRQTTK